MTHKNLTSKQKVFVKEYVKTGHIQNSAVEAGYGSSPKSAAQIASRMMKEEKIIRAIEQLRGEVQAAVIKGHQEFDLGDIKEVVIGRNDLTHRALETYEDAKRDRQHGVRIQALRFLAELHNMVDAGDVKNINNFTLNLLENEDRSARAKTINGTMSAEAQINHQAARQV